MFILLGAVLIVLGLGIIIEPRYQHVTSGYYFDFTGYNIPFGIVLIIIGGLFIWTTLRKKEDKS